MPQGGEVRAQLDRLLSRPAFSLSLRRGQLLRYLVERTLDDESDAINEYAIGVDVFERPASFDPRIESIVRTEAGRLRQKLKEYYATDGADDRILIEIPPRGYQPVFAIRAPQATPALPIPVAPEEHSRGRWAATWPVIAALLLLSAAGAALWRVNLGRGRPIHSLVVLPFQNFSPNGADQYLADGLTDELTNEFANWKDLRVVARTSAFQYKGKGVDVRQIGRDLRVDAALEGSLAREGDHVRITAQLNRTEDGYHLWSHAYDTRSGDMLTVQREIAQAIAGAVSRLGIKAPSQLTRPSTNNPEALDLYLRASYQYARLTPASIGESIGLFHAAIDKDPSYARAYTGLAAAELELTSFNSPSSEAFARARASLAEALRLDPDAGDAHGLLAEIEENRDWDWPRAEREYQVALEKGAQASTRAAYGWSLAWHGRYADAQQQCATAENLEPLGIAPRFCQFYVYYYQRQFAKAQSTLQETLELKPGLIYAHLQLGRVALLMRECAEADRQFASAAQALAAPEATVHRAYECSCRGETDRAQRYLRQAASTISPGKIYELAIGYALVHDRDAAVVYLRKSAAAREPLVSILRDPAFDELHGDARFTALENLAGLER